MSEPQINRLSDARPGTRGAIAVLKGGRSFQSRLASMGLNIGSWITVIHGGNGSGGPVLVARGETRLALGRGMAEKILITPELNADTTVQESEPTP